MGSRESPLLSYESEVAQSCPTLCDLMASSIRPWLLHPWDFQGKNTVVGCHFVSSPGREQREEAGSLMTIRALIPYMRAPLLGPYLILFTTQASPLPINIILKGGDSTYEFGEGAQIFSPLQSYNFIVEN